MSTRIVAKTFRLLPATTVDLSCCPTTVKPRCNSKKPFDQRLDSHG